MIALAARPAVLAAVDRARSVSVSAYVLPKSVTRHLVRAAHRGAAVRLRLPAYPYAGTYEDAQRLARENRAAADAVRRAGGDARLLSAKDPLHLKAVLVDDRTAYLDDRNWSDDGAQTILVDDEPGDLAMVRDAFDRKPMATDRMATAKPASLALECRLIDAVAGDRLDVETESFGIGPVYDALERRAGAGHPSRLLVCQREIGEARDKAAAGNRPPGELRALDRLTADGVDVRVTPEGEKMAVGPDAAWVGSTNATRDWGSTAKQLDWGMITRGPAIVGALRTRFEETWRAAVPYASQVQRS